VYRSLLCIAGVICSVGCRCRLCAAYTSSKRSLIAAFLVFSACMRDSVVSASCCVLYAAFVVFVADLLESG
jgi:hypothetical protein